MHSEIRECLPFQCICEIPRRVISRRNTAVHSIRSDHQRRERVKILGQFRNRNGQVIFFFFFLDIVEIKEGGKKRKRNFVYEIREGRAYRAFLPSFRRMEKLLVFPWSTARSQILDVTFVPKNSDEQEGKGEEKVEILWKKCLTWLLLGRRHSVARRKTFFSRGPPWQPMVFFLFFTPRALRVNAKIYLRCYLWRREHAVHIQSLRH